MSKKPETKQKPEANKDTKNTPGSPKTDPKKGEKAQKVTTDTKNPDKGSKQHDEHKIKEEQELIQLRLNQVIITAKKGK